MKKIVSFVLAAFLLIGTCRADDPSPETSGAAMILFHAASGTVLAEKNPAEPMLVASTTKLMTALVAAESGDLSRETVVRPEWCAVEGSSMYLRPGETYTLRELLEGLLLASGNDAALAVADSVSGSEAAFVDAMNAAARQLGCLETHFSNPHGLDAPDHRSSARDLARIMAAVLEIPDLREILGMRSCTVHGVCYVNHNKLLWNCSGVNGGKTGYTMAAGRCLVSSCRRDGLELICVTLADPNDWKDHAALYEWAFREYRCLNLSEESPVAYVPVISGGLDRAAVSPARSAVLCLPADSRVTLGFSLPPFAFAPVRSGEAVGKLTVCADGRPVEKLDLVWAQDAPSVRISGAESPRRTARYSEEIVI